MGDSTLRSLTRWSRLAVLPALLLAGCATAGTARAPEPLAPPAGETYVMLRDLGPGQPLVAFGRRSAHLPPAANLRLRDDVSAEALRRGVERVRAASTPTVPAPSAPPRPAGATWGGNVEEGARPTGRPIPLAGATWLEITGLTLDQARLVEAPGGTALTLEVAAERTDAPPAGGPPQVREARFTLVDPAPLAALDAPPGEEDPAGAEAIRAATTRLLDRAAARLASLLVAPPPPPPPAAASSPAPPDPAAADPGPAVPLEVTYVARTWVAPPVPSQTGRYVAEGALKGGQAGSYLGLLGVLCGPLAPVCMGALALAGGGVGLVAGAVGGAAEAPATPPSGPMQAKLPPEPERRALLEALRRQVEGLALAATVERAARQAQAEVAPGVAPPRLARLEVRLAGDDGPDDPARLALVVTAAPPPGQAAPDVLVVETPDRLPARTWVEDGALVREVLARAAEAAGKALVVRAAQATVPPAARPAPTT